MSKVWTYQEVVTKVRNDLDMTDELIVTASEMLDYCNAAIEEAEAEIKGLYQDYFLNFYDVPLVGGQSIYTLPTDIFINNIRGTVYQNGAVMYEVKQIKGQHKFLKIAFGQYITASTDDYRYFLTNPSVAVGYQFNLVPVSRDTGNFLRMWYIRTAARVALPTDPIDIPQFAQFIIEFTKGMCKAKENGGQMPPDAASAIEQKRKLMVDTLTQMIPDNDDFIEQDHSIYHDMS